MLSEFINRITGLIEQVVAAFGAPGIWLIAVLETIFPPTPSEALYPLAGKMAFEGKVTILAVVVAGIIGSLAGSMFYYALGYQLGEARIRNTIERYGTFHVLGVNFRLLSVQDLDRGLSWFARYGSSIVFVARLLPLVHGVVSIPAGVIRMNIGVFLLYTALGAATWITPLVLLGYWLGEHWEDVLLWMDLYQNVVLVAGAIFLIVYIAWRRFLRPRFTGQQTHL